PDDYIRDIDSAQLPGYCTFRRAQAASQPEEDRRILDVAHGDVGDGHIDQQPAIHCYHANPTGVVDHDVGDCDVLEPAVGFGAEFDPARWTITIRSLFHVLLIS